MFGKKLSFAQCGEMFAVSFEEGVENTCRCIDEIVRDDITWDNLFTEQNIIQDPKIQEVKLYKSEGILWDMECFVNELRRTFPETVPANVKRVN